MKHFLSTLLHNIVECFSLRNLRWHLLAILLTYFITTSDFDWHYFLFFRNATLFAFFFPALILGSLLPIVVPLSLIAIGVKKNRVKEKTMGFAIAQAAIIASFISSFYKTFTGRIEPNLVNFTVDISHEWNFGFLRHGIFWGWPSSHTTIAFAMACTLICLFRKNRAIFYGALLYAFYIGFGVSISIHWFSEFVAGAIIGSVIGMVVGTHFRTILEKQ